MSIWTYKNACSKSGITDGEPMFEFNADEAANELGRTPAERDRVMSDLQLIFGHDFNAHDVDTVFLTMQEFQVLTMKYGDFFDAATVPFRRSAFVHFVGISSGVGRFDSQNAVRVTNMQHTRDGSRIAIRKLESHERVHLYFGQSNAAYSRAAMNFRRICIGDHLFLGHKTFPTATGNAEYLPAQDIAIMSEMRNPNPSVQFVTDDKTHTLTLTPGVSGYYYLFTATPDFAATLVAQAPTAFFTIGRIGAVHKINPLTPRVDPNFYHLIRIPSIQRSEFTVTLTGEMVRETIPAAPRMTIGAPVPESVTVEVPIAAAVANEAAPSPLKRTPADAGLPAAASKTSAEPAASSKRARAAVGAATAAAANPMS